MKYIASYCHGNFGPVKILVWGTKNWCPRTKIFGKIWSILRKRGALLKFTTAGAHDIIAITSPQKNDLCTEEL